MRLMHPDLNAKRAQFSDWLELIAVCTGNDAPFYHLHNLLRFQTNDRVSAIEFDPAADAEGDPEVTDRAVDDLEERVAEEIEYRARAIGKSYPFRLVASGSGATLKLELVADWDDLRSGKLVYIFCLLDSAIRYGLISTDSSDAGIVRDIGLVFQICACLAVGGYTKAEVYSFGFPRATGSGFLAALQDVWKRYDSYEVLTYIPPGFDDRLKDGGIDIIAWRHFDDRHAATLLMFVQVASGMDWKDKEVSGDVRALKQWFTGPRFEHFTPAICIPFPLWFDLDEPPREPDGTIIPYLQSIKGKYAFRESKFGIIFDRGRIARSVAAVYRGEREFLIDGEDMTDRIRDWVSIVLDRVGRRRSAA